MRPSERRIGWRNCWFHGRSVEPHAFEGGDGEIRAEHVAAQLLDVVRGERVAASPIIRMASHAPLSRAFI